MPSWATNCIPRQACSQTPRRLSVLAYGTDDDVYNTEVGSYTINPRTTTTSSSRGFTIVASIAEGTTVGVAASITDNQITDTAFTCLTCSDQASRNFSRAHESSRQFLIMCFYVSIWIHHCRCRCWCARLRYCFSDHNDKEHDYRSASPINLR